MQYQFKYLFALVEVSQIADGEWRSFFSEGTTYYGATELEVVEKAIAEANVVNDHYYGSVAQYYVWTHNQAVVDAQIEADKISGKHDYHDF